MGIYHEQKSNAPFTPMDQFPHHTRHQDPPPYAYEPLTPSTSAPTSPVIPRADSKTILVPPPRNFTPPPHVVAQSPLTALDPRNPLPTCDTRFANIILTNIILPRLRVGVMNWKDRETFEYVPQTKEDVH